jgi:hypothetical protein
VGVSTFSCKVGQLQIDRWWNSSFRRRGRVQGRRIETVRVRCCSKGQGVVVCRVASPQILPNEVYGLIGLACQAETAILAERLDKEYAPIVGIPAFRVRSGCAVCTV